MDDDPPSALPPTSGPTRYRVEHRHAYRTTVLGTLTGCRPHFRSLDAYVSHLTHAGKPGWVLLVDDATGRVLIRRQLAGPATAVRSG